ncbi:beta-ketoacyl-[acyl-carrier-protein] synthase family protein [Dyadobacter sandarakinus]|uniref:Beta-ketoacyl-[acyl-carrier-protein] synthase family protein n=1 Tax=Dyadobacter sandarakinus TaxID=2747268 RepID=A0ABX7ICZ0_9BACT|nr:beta-ketoacyl-[acyl-carrier-protein] synthase family protein [Dyadobacter sandarakinus]QRR03977.1 beta-ketoacyl-[acyl-carrier-protein] synthase family protein [Dyadobacter sandarakinus]
MKKRVLVTGMGIISAAGDNLTENFDSLHQARTGIGKAVHFRSRYADQLPFGECRPGNEMLKAWLGLEQSRGYTRTCLLASAAFEEAVRHAGLAPELISSPDTAFISASTVGGMCLTDQLYHDANLRSEGSEYLEAYGAAAHTMRLIERYRITGFTDTVNTACSSSANAILLGARLIASGRARRAIVGGVDSLAKYTVNGFNALKILSEEPCKPFDEFRDGLNLGEGAAYLVLEAEEDAASKTTYAEICGYGNSNDAFHPSAMSAEGTGAILSMQQAVRTAGIGFDEVSYVNAHGTGTPNNDEVELFALKSVFEKVPPFSSTKSYTGHTLGAAGAVEAIFSILSIMHSKLFPCLHLTRPIHEAPQPVAVLTSGVAVNYVLSNSFGFGGNCTSLLIGRVQQPVA